MPRFGSPFSGLANAREFNDDALIKAIRFRVTAEYDTTQLHMQLAESTDNNLAVQAVKTMNFHHSSLL